MFAVVNVNFTCAKRLVSGPEIQVHEDPAYEMGFPIELINLGIDEPKPGDVAITAAHRAIRAFFKPGFGRSVGLQIHVYRHLRSNPME